IVLGAALVTLDDVWAWLYRHAIGRMTGPQALRDYTVPMPIEQAPESAPPDLAGLRNDVRGALEQDIADLHRLVTGKDPGSKFDMAHIRQMLATVKTWADYVFGHIAVGPELDEIRIHDVLADRTEQMQSWDEDRKRSEAREWLMRSILQGE